MQFAGVDHLHNPRSALRFSTMGETPIAKLARWWVRTRQAAQGVPDDQPHQCMLGARGHLPEEDRCEQVVPAHGGYRDDGEVFCSREHALEAQGDRAI